MTGSRLLGSVGCPNVTYMLESVLPLSAPPKHKKFNRLFASTKRANHGHACPIFETGNVSTRCTVSEFGTAIPARLKQLFLHSKMVYRPSLPVPSNRPFDSDDAPNEMRLRLSFIGRYLVRLRRQRLPGSSQNQAHRVGTRLRVFICATQMAPTNTAPRARTLERYTMTTEWSP